MQLKEPTWDTVFAIIYTSGTSDEIKGVILTHQNILASQAKQEFFGYTFDSDDVYFSYVPLPHVYEQIMMASSMIFRFRVGYSKGNPLNLL
jgi:long-chain acyl-CoA synthetase